MSGEAHAKLGVAAGDSKQLRDIDQVVAWTFGQAKNLKPGTSTRSWVARSGCPP